MPHRPPQTKARAVQVHCHGNKCTSENPAPLEENHSLRGRHGCELILGRRSESEPGSLGKQAGPLTLLNGGRPPSLRQKALPGEPTQQDRLPLHGPAPKANPSPISPSRCLWELQIKIKRVPTDVPPHPCHRQLRSRLEGGYYFTQSRVPREPVSCLERRGASRLES